MFGYITEGADQVYKIENGDRLISAKVIEGEDKLVVPPPLPLSLPSPPPPPRSDVVGEIRN